MPDEPSRKPWHKLPSESRQAYAAFCAYYRLPPSHRSVAAVWRAATGQSESSEKRIPGRYNHWCSAHGWVERAIAHDEYLAEQERLKWEQRRQQLLEADWQQGEQLRAVVVEAIPHARHFIHQTTTETSDGRTIVTLSFDITALARVLEQASKLQRLATDEPTDHLALSGAALDAYIAAQLARLADSDQAPDGIAPQPHEAEADWLSAGGNDAL